MSERVPIDPERLLAQTAWVRRLARSLARDEASADDLVQETFVAALRRPPSGAQDEPRLRAWFGFVLRNMALRRARGEARREERERRSADGRRTDSDERVDELEELRSELVRHVKTLPDASREIVLLRYFEELDSAQIARRLSLPDSTVRNRLRRALAELRERLARSHGSDWRDLCLFVLPTNATRGGVATGALLAGGGWVLGAAGACAALLAVLWLAFSRPEQLARSAAADALAREHTPVSDLIEPSAVALSTPIDAERQEQAAALRIDVRTGIDLPPATRFAHGIVVYGTVRDEAGEPVDGVGLTWTDAWGGTHGTCTSEGKYSANSLAPGRQILRLSGSACAEELREITLDPDVEMQPFDLVVRRLHAVPVFVFGTDGENLFDPRADRPRLRPMAGVVVTLGPPPGRMALVHEPGDFHPDWRATADDGWIAQHAPCDATGLALVCAGEPTWVSLVDRGTVLATQRFDAPPERIEFRLPRETFELGNGSPAQSVGPGSARAWRSWRQRPEGVPLRLRFLDECARPVMANVRVCDAAGTLVWSSTARMDGHVDCDELKPGRYRVEVTGSRDDFDPAFTPVGTLPRELEVEPCSERREVVVPLVRLRSVLLAGRLGTHELVDWEIQTREGLRIAQGFLVGHAPKCVGLPPGEFTLRIRPRHARTLLAEREFELHDDPLTIGIER